MVVDLSESLDCYMELASLFSATSRPSYHLESRLHSSSWSLVELQLAGYEDIGREHGMAHHLDL